MIGKSYNGFDDIDKLMYFVTNNFVNVQNCPIVLSDQAKYQLLDLSSNEFDNINDCISQFFVYIVLLFC